ncbi:unnamed protein product, partial [Brachionus calyciflorus]
MESNEGFDKYFKLLSDKNSEFYIEEQEFEHELIEGHSVEFLRYKNMLFPNIIKNIHTVKHLKLRSDDTFVIGYPKSGTTWTEEIVWLLQHNLDFEKAKSIRHFERVLYIDTGLSKGKLRELEEAKDTRVFKSHLPIEYLPDNLNELSKVIYVERNPKDMLVSLYNFKKSLIFSRFTGSFDLMVDHFVNNKLWFGPWWEHINKYHKIPGIFIVQYEDLLQNPVEIIKSMSEYLGKDYSIEEIKKLIEFTTIDKMRENPSFKLDWIFVDEDNSKQKFNFFRKGQIGNWTEYFNDDLSMKVDQVIKDKVSPCIKFKYFSNESN